MERFNHIPVISGELNLPGDKSISHRAVIFASIAEGRSVIHNISPGEDVLSTINCFKQLGVDIAEENNQLVISGKGINGFKRPSAPLYAGNSGTTARLLSGLLIHQKFESVITGDQSLSARPMKRIITPLSAMGGKISASDDFKLPLRFYPSDKLNPIRYELPVPSAQIKSAVLLSGLHFNDDTFVIENIPSRSHTEVMLSLPVEETDGRKIIRINSSYMPGPAEYNIPADISSASFFIVLALLTPGSKLIIKNVLLNPTRTGIISVLIEMGGNIELLNRKQNSGEPAGDLLVRSSKLKNISIDKNLIPNIIDEIPVLAAAAVFAEGDFYINNAAELRAKESDRIKAVCSNLIAAGLTVEDFEDGFAFKGNLKNETLRLKSFGDHRIAMSGAVLSMLHDKGGEVEDFGCVNISNPGFLTQIKSVCSL